MKPWVKICGITRTQDAEAAFAAGADAIGINFWPGSKRYCDPDSARAIVAALGPGPLVFGVFVGATRSEIESVVATVGLGGVQFHGEEPAAETHGWAVPVIRAVAASSREAVAAALEEARVHRQALASQRGGAGIDYRILVDNAGGGGSGRLVEASVLDRLDLSDAVVAGGLTPANVSAIVARFAPFGVDTAGGVEVSPGIKDARAIEEFIGNARSSRR